MTRKRKTTARKQRKLKELNQSEQLNKNNLDASKGGSPDTTHIRNVQIKTNDWGASNNNHQGPTSG